MRNRDRLIFKGMSTARLTPRFAVPYRCPICRSQVCEILEGRQSPLGERLAVYRCAGCSVLFTDPASFTRFEPYSASAAHPPPDIGRAWKAGRDEA